MHLRFIIIAIAACTMTDLAFAADLDITDHWNNHKHVTSISVITNNVLLIQTTNGQKALVQFTTFDTDNPTYKWRYRAGTNATIRSGSGTVRESYDEKAQPDGRIAVKPKVNHSPIVKAGDLHMEWSFGSSTNGYVYYATNLATVRVLGREAFGSDL